MCCSLRKALCCSDPAQATTKEEASVEQLLQKLPPISVHPNSAALVHWHSFPTLPDTPEFIVPTCEVRGKAMNKFLLPSALQDLWTEGRGS